MEQLGTGGCGRKRTKLVGGTPGNWPLSAVLTSERLKRKQPGTENDLDPKGSSCVSIPCGRQEEGNQAWPW